MNTDTDLERVAARYRRMSDSEIVRLTLEEIGDLRPEVLPLLQHEVHRRKLPNLFLEMLEIQRHGLSAEAFDVLVHWYRSQPCPSCGTSGVLLNGCLIEGILLIGCSTCLRREARQVLDGSPSATSLIHRIVNAPEHNSIIEEALGEAPTLALLDHIQRNAATLYTRMRHR